MKNKYLYKDGNRTEDYKSNELLSMKWHIEYKIISSIYNAVKDQTTIKLERL
jgi:hypothetical protein